MWYAELIKVSLTRRHIFWHSGALHRAEPLGPAIEASAPEGCSVAVVDCECAPLTREHDLDVQALGTCRADLLVLTNLDHLLRVRRGYAWLRQLRAPVMQLIDAGIAVLVASNTPRRSYPAVDGSSIATDCFQYVMRPDAHGIVESMSLDRGRIDWLMKECAGSRALAATLLGIDWELSQKRRAALVAEELRRVVRTALLECGAEVLAWVEDEFLLRRRHTFRADEVPAEVYETLSAAGLADIDAATDTLQIFPHIHKSAAADAVVRANAAISEAPSEWVTAASLLFEFERLLRRIIDRYVQSHEHLRESTIRSYKDKILNNYRYDTGINEKDVNRVPLPWNWVDLSDLLIVAEQFATDQRLAELTARAWQRAHEDVVPFRNRIQHMRFPRPGEIDRLRTLVRELRLSLSRDSD